MAAAGPGIALATVLATAIANFSTESAIVRIAVVVEAVEVAALAELLVVESAAVVLVFVVAVAAAAAGNPVVPVVVAVAVAEGRKQLSASLLALSQPLLLPWPCQCPFASGNGKYTCALLEAKRGEAWCYAIVYGLLKQGRWLVALSVERAALVGGGCVAASWGREGARMRSTWFVYHWRELPSLWTWVLPCYAVLRTPY